MRRGEKPSENPLWVALSHDRSFPRKRESSGWGLNTRDGTQSFQTASEVRWYRFAQPDKITDAVAQRGGGGVFAVGGVEFVRQDHLIA